MLSLTLDLEYTGYMADGDGYWKQTEVLQRQHWTPALIRKLLGNPDQLKKWTYYGRKGVTYLYSLDRVVAAEGSDDFKTELARRRKLVTDMREIPLINAIREVSWGAHRWRDAAQSQYRSGLHGLAGSARKRKEYLYTLKERGIMAAHRDALLRYVGASPQGLAVYEYDEGGMACFHSRLHPVGVDRPLVSDHPEILFVQAKQARHRIKNAIYTLSLLPDASNGYEAVPAPRIEKAKDIVCFRCKQPGHVAANCPLADDFDDEFDDEEFEL